MDESGTLEPEAKAKPPSYKPLEGKVYNGNANRPLTIVELLGANIEIIAVFVVAYDKLDTVQVETVGF